MSIAHLLFNYDRRTGVTLEPIGGPWRPPIQYFEMNAFPFIMVGLMLPYNLLEIFHDYNIQHRS